MKTRPIIIALAVVFFSGCLQSTLNLPPSKSKLEKIEAGTLESSVRIIAGEPDKIVKSKTGFSTYYYRKGLTSDCKKDLQTCIPIIIDKGKVVAVGRQWSKSWKQQHSRRVTPRSVKSSTSKSGRKDSRAEIEKLEKHARAIPLSRTMDNLSIYRYLLKLDPENPQYQEKITFYENRFEKEKAEKVARKKQQAITWKWQNQRLQEFKGDTPVQLAAKILSAGKFHVWLKNTGEIPFRVDARHFFLSCGKNKRYTIYNSKDFGQAVEPGAVIDGRITFVIDCEPREIIYANPDVATLARKIPVPELPADTSPGEKKK